MQAQDVMVRGVISVGPDIPVRIAANAMVSNGVSAVLVMDISAKLVGIVSEGDLIRRVENDTERQRSVVARNVHVDRRSGEGIRQIAWQAGERRDDTRRDRGGAGDAAARNREPDGEAWHQAGADRDRTVLVVGIVSRANLLQALASANEDTEWIESDRVLRQRILDSIKDQPWASRGRSMSSSMIAAPICGDLSTARMRKRPSALLPRRRPASSLLPIICASCRR